MKTLKSLLLLASLLLCSVIWAKNFTFESLISPTSYTPSKPAIAIYRVTNPVTNPLLVSDVSLLPAGVTQNSAPDVGLVGTMCSVPTFSLQPGASCYLKLLVTQPVTNGSFQVCGGIGRVGNNCTFLTETPSAHLLNVANANANRPFVQVGDAGVIATTTDLVTLNTVNAAPQGVITDVAMGLVSSQDIYVALSDTPAIYTSTDKMIWTKVKDASNRLNSIAWSPTLNLFAAVGVSGVLYTSADGTHWTAATINGGTTLNKITWSALNSKFIAVGNNLSVVTSTNGVNWNAATVPPVVGGAPILDAALNDVSCGATYCVTVGAKLNNATYPALYFSTNGTSWTLATDTSVTDLTNPLDAVFCQSSGAQCVMSGEQGVVMYSSTPTAAWTAATINQNTPTGIPVIPQTTKWTAIGWSGSEYVAVTNNIATAIFSLTNIIMTSPDGIHWTMMSNIQTFQNLQAVHYFTPTDGTASFWMAVGDVTHIGFFMINADATAQADWSFLGLKSVAYGLMPATPGARPTKPVYVTVGTTGTILVNTDGTGTTWTHANWTPKKAGAKSNFAGAFTDVTYAQMTNGAQFFAVGDGGEVSSSTDGVNWTEMDTHNATTKNLSGVACSATLCAAVGDTGTILTWFLSGNWAFSVANSQTTTNLYSIINTGDRFIAGGALATILLSYNGSDWTTVSSSGTSAYDINSIVYTGTQYVATASSSPYNVVQFASTLFSSTNGGILWSPIPSIGTLNTLLTQIFYQPGASVQYLVLANLPTSGTSTGGSSTPSSYGYMSQDGTAWSTGIQYPQGIFKAIG